MGDTGTWAIRDMWLIIITVHDTSLSVISCNFLSQCSLGDKSKPVKTKKRKAHPIRYHSKLNNIRPETHVSGKEKKKKKKKKKKKPGENKENPKLKAKFTFVPPWQQPRRCQFFLLEINVCFPKRHGTIYFFPSSLSMKTLWGDTPSEVRSLPITRDQIVYKNIEIVMWDSIHSEGYYFQKRGIFMQSIFWVKMFWTDEYLFPRSTSEGFLRSG